MYVNQKELKQREKETQYYNIDLYSKMITDFNKNKHKISVPIAELKYQ